MSQSWSCKWKDGELPPRAARRERLKGEVARRFAERGGRDGSPRICAALRDAGWRVSENTVAGLMREQGLAARRKKKRKATTRPGRGRWRAPDQVRRKFAAGGINRRWYGGVIELAGKAVGAAFVGVTAACLAIAEALRELHGGTGHDTLLLSLTTTAARTSPAGQTALVPSARLRP